MKPLWNVGRILIAVATISLHRTSWDVVSTLTDVSYGLANI